MNWTLVIGDPAYSSWSLRAWLLFDRFNLPMSLQHVSFAEHTVAAQIPDYSPARTVPTVRTPEGTVIWDSLAIAEELATRVPAANLWPAEPAQRATARAVTAEMHSGFSALRTTCPMNLRMAHIGFPVPEEVKEDLARLEMIWTHARAMSVGDGPWLFGAYSIADAFFAPVAARIATYDLELGASAQAYVAAHLADPAFRRWRALGLTHGPDLPWYFRDYPQRMWPGPTPRSASVVSDGVSENTVCPYSGGAISHLIEVEGRIFGFCNAGCRDKTLVDPDAFPAFSALLAQ